MKFKSKLRLEKEIKDRCLEALRHGLLGKRLVIPLVLKPDLKIDVDKIAKFMAKEMMKGYKKPKI